MINLFKKFLRNFIPINAIARLAGVNVYCPKKGKKRDYEIEKTYRTSGGVELPVYKHYRYMQKPGWEYYGPLSALNDLRKKSLLSEEDEKFLKKAIGDNTLTVPLNQAYDVLKKYQAEYKDLFLMNEIPLLGKRLLKPTKNEIEKEISRTVFRHKRMLKSVGYNNKKSKVLEIGYTSGGVSIAAFERLGFEAHAVDYYFNDTVKETLRHEYIKKLTNSNVNFYVGDITKRIIFNNNQFDLVYSNSVIEHILDLNGAFSEIYRILKPGGLSVHYYGSFLFPAGGHSLGTLDSPWAHVRLKKEDYYNYIRELRPYEAEVAIEWIENSLCPDYTMAKVQKSIIDSGFEIKLWQNNRISEADMADLNKEILSDCFKNIPSLTVEDLTTRSTFFVIKKSNR